jgi:hypothetical protein
MRIARRKEVKSSFRQLKFLSGSKTYLREYFEKEVAA